MAIVLCLLVLDLGVLNRKDHVIGVKESLKLSAFYIAVGLLFGGWVWWELGQTKAVEYWTGFVVEKTLAMDNIFVIAMIFSYMAVPRLYQHRVLFWGILGVIVLRGVMIGLGASLVAEFHWILYGFGAFLVISGLKIALSSGEETNLENNAVLSFMTRYMRVTKTLHGHQFFVRAPLEESEDRDDKNKTKNDKDTNGRNTAAPRMALFVTPLFVTLVMIEVADVIFAVDSIPAIFGITLDPYIVYTSNIFAILGLRALYFALAALMERFVYLKYALALILVFIGAKLLLVDMLGLGKCPPLVSLAVTVAILVGGIACSLFKTRGKTPAASSFTED